MRRDNRFLLFGFIFFCLAFSNVFSSKALGDPFYPLEGTSSTYRWDFNGFSSICALNDSHIDFNKGIESEVCVDNPTSSEFTVSYQMAGDFLEEAIDGVLNNQSISLKMKPSYLINLTTREYVNELGEASSAFANGYIDPRNISLGSHVLVGFTDLTVTAKEKIKVIGSMRETWKLEYISSSNNQTLYYDALTGILISAKFETFEASIGSSAYFVKSEFNKEIVDHLQVLIATTAWKSSFSTNFPIIEPWIVLFSTLIVRQLKRREEKR